MRATPHLADLAKQPHGVLSLPGQRPSVGALLVAFWAPTKRCDEARTSRTLLIATSSLNDDAEEEEFELPTYVSLLNWTEQGIKNFKDSTKRANDFTKMVEGSGGKVRELLWTVGEYDLVSVIDFPDDESAVASLLRLGSAGSIRTKTLRAFDAKQMEGIVAKAT